MQQYPKVRRVTHRGAKAVFERGEVVVLEKLDGNDVRFWPGEAGRPRFGSRRTKLGSDPDDVGGQFDAVTDYPAERYCTPARVRKAAHRLVDEGAYEGLRMSMMADLPMAVVDDVWAEEHAEIARTDWMVDMAEVRSEVSRRWVPVLRDPIDGDER